MKTKMKIAGIMLIALMFVSNNLIMAQSAGVPNTKAQDKKEKVESMKVAYLADKLNLTPAEAEKFWPVYNEFQDKREVIQKTLRQKLKIVKNNDADQLTEAQADELINAQLEQEQGLLDLKKEYMPKFKKLIGSKKVVALFLAEKDFNKLLLDKIKDKKE